MWLVIALAFLPIASSMAFLITYEEWSHHRIPRKERLRRSFELAIATLLFFAGVLAVAYVGFVSLSGVH